MEENNRNWLESNTPSSWYGISVRNGHISEISMSSNRLRGSIPVAIGNLPNLEAIYLFDNELTGTIPNEIGLLKGLKKLILWNNQLSGTIPSGIGELSNLTELVLSQNQLSGPLPPSICNLSMLGRPSLFQKTKSVARCLPTSGSLQNLKCSLPTKTNLLAHYPKAL